MKVQYPELKKLIGTIKSISLHGYTKNIDSETKIEIQNKNKILGAELLEDLTKKMNDKYSFHKIYVYREYFEKNEYIHVNSNNKHVNFSISFDLSFISIGEVMIRKKPSTITLDLPLEGIREIIEKVKTDALEMIKEMPKYRLYFVTNEIRIKG